MRPPAYFDAIKSKAAERWVQLEADAELAAPWHQLFAQVQSPSHVISELLQNADDAGATRAHVYIEGDTFVFEHNGEDFAQEHFASLCRFGYSNKRLLHTIGFRGIGFKSTFSIGDTVNLDSPSLAVSFNRRRFTEPLWRDQAKASANTKIFVQIADKHRRKELEKSLAHWAQSPLSLLFFKNIRSLQIADEEIHWESGGPGPVTGTEWMALASDENEKYLVVRSQAEEFPAECLEEIRQERLLSEEDIADFPPCSIDLVLGAEGKLYVVLPTGVEVDLPFACNAPFIQDPARLKIKDPDISPTNRWLLSRFGELAATVMCRWLADASLDIGERAEAYKLMPNVDRKSSTLAKSCATMVEEAFDSAIEDQPVVLTNAGTLVLGNQAVALPPELAAVWPMEECERLFDENARPALATAVSSAARQKLDDWDLIDNLSRNDLIDRLRDIDPPRPKTWRNLLELWAWLSPELTKRSWQIEPREIRLVPAENSQTLHAANELVRIGEKKLVQSAEDWSFLSRYLRVMHQKWPPYLAEQRRLNSPDDAASYTGKVEAAYRLLNALELEQTSDVSQLVATVATGIVADGNSVTTSDCVRLAQIAAKLQARVEDAFPFLVGTEEGPELLTAEEPILFDVDGVLVALLPDSLDSAYRLHPEYTKAWVSCTREEWCAWVRSGRAKLAAFPAIEVQSEYCWNKRAMRKRLKRAGCKNKLKYQYSSPSFRIHDLDFAPELWAHWESLAKDDPKVWGQIFEAILAQPSKYWSDKLTATVKEVASNGHVRTCMTSGIPPMWIRKLAGKPCLRDTRGFYRQPTDLLRRTPATESLLEVEHFVHAELDTEAHRGLFDLLGVRNTPTGPTQLLERLRALAQAEQPLVSEVEKWYLRLDNLFESCATPDQQAIITAFQEEKLLLTADHEWVQAAGAFLSGDDEELPGAPLVLPSVQNIALWRKVGVADRPTASRIIVWFNSLPTREPMSADDLRRVKAFIGRHPARVWNECEHWLNLAGEWVPIEDLSFGLAMQNLVPWSHLHAGFKRQTADLRNLPHELVVEEPFSRLKSLSAEIENRIDESQAGLGSEQHKEWLTELGRLLSRVKMDDADEQARLRAVGRRLRRTVWRTAANLKVTPYIDGDPAGTPLRSEAVWLGDTLYVVDRSAAQLAKVVATELGRAFVRSEIIDAIKLCYDRSAKFVADYVNENFDIAPVVEEDEQAAEGRDQTGEGVRPEGGSAATRPVETKADDDTGSETGGKALAEVEEEEEPEPEDSTAADGEDTDPDEPDTKPRAKRRPPEPTTIERYAATHGFAKDGEGRFYRRDGAWLDKSGDVFPWALHKSEGDVACYYLVRNQCLEHGPLELPAEAWSLLGDAPDGYGLILVDGEGKPAVVSGRELLAMQSAGELEIYPASYRLVLERKEQKRHG